MSRTTRSDGFANLQFSEHRNADSASALRGLLNVMGAMPRMPHGVFQFDERTLFYKE
jgi:hypothetical protein